MNNQTINEALGVKNERASYLKAILMAAVYITCHEQDVAAGGEASGYDTCEGVENAMKFAESKEEAFVVGEGYSDLDRKFDEVGISSFVHSVGIDYTDGQSIEDFAKVIITKAEEDRREEDNILK